MEAENDKHRLLIDHLPDGFAYHELITDSTGTPVDYVFLDVNPAFEAMTGLQKDKLIGKKVTAVLPGIETSGFDWIGTYGKVALTGESVRLEQYSEPLERWYEVTAYSDAPGYFATLFRDISARKHEKSSLETLARLAEKYLHFPLGELDYQVITDDLLALSGAKYSGFNTYTEDGKHTITRALSGIAPALRQAADLLGFELIGKEWAIIPERLERFKDGRLTRFDNLYDTACGAISRQTASLVQKMFALGEVYVMGMEYGERLLGDMIFIMGKGEKLQNPQLIELYSKQAALALVRTRAEKKLQQREQQLNAVIEGQTELVCRYLPDCTLTFVNEAYCRYFGKQKEDLLGTSFLSLVPEADIESSLKHLASFTPDRPLATFEHRVITPLGDIRWQQWTDRAFFDREGRVTEYQSVGRDITERKQAEEELRRSEERYKHISEQAPVGMFQFKISVQGEGAFTYISPGSGVILGISVDAVLKDWMELHNRIHQDYQNAFNDAMRISATELSLFNEIFLFISDKRGEIWLQVKSDPQRLNDGSILWTGVFIGVDNEKRFEENLQKEKVRLQNIIEGTNAGTWECNLATGETILNENWANVLGYTLEELTPATIEVWVSNIHPDDRPEAQAILEKHIQGVLEYYECEVRMKHKEGHYIWVFGKGKIISWTEDAKPEWMYGTHQNITDRKKAEEALNYRLQFEQLVSEISSKFINLSAKELNEGVSYALKLTGEFFQVDRSYVFQFSADGQRMSNTHEWCAAGVVPQNDKIQNVPVESLPWWAERIRNHDYVHIPDVYKLPPEATAEQADFQQQGIQSLLTVPLRSKDRFIGFLGFDSVETKKTWTEETISLLKVIADILVNAFEKSKTEEKILDYTMELELKGIELEELYQQLDQEIDKARAIHEKTLPKKVPEIEGLSLHAYYHPAQRMGGDFYNSIQVGSKLILYIYDVSGHGLEGALLSAFAKATIDSYVSLKPEEIEPENILSHLNRQYRRENYPADYFICIFLMVLDLNTMELTYTGLGFQDQPLVQMGNGKKSRLNNEGLPISSAIPEEIMDFTTGMITLSPGTTVLINTDGITEQKAGEAQYNSRLEKVFYEHSHLPPEIIMSAVKEDFYRFNGGSMQGDDDITLGIIQVEPKEKRELYLELENNFDVLPSMRQTISSFIPDHETAALFLIGLHELTSNAMEHGNRFDPQKKVKVNITAMEHYVAASIEDEGPGFDWISRKDKPLKLDDESERGRGIAMIQVCGGKLYYNEKGNRAFLVFAY